MSIFNSKRHDLQGPKSCSSYQISVYHISFNQIFNGRIQPAGIVHFIIIVIIIIIIILTIQKGFA